MNSDAAQHEWSYDARSGTVAPAVARFDSRTEDRPEVMQRRDEACRREQADSRGRKTLAIENLPLSAAQIRKTPADGVFVRVRQRYRLDTDRRLRAGWEVYSATALEDDSAVIVNICVRAIPDHLITKVDQQLAFWAALQHENLESILAFEVTSEGLWMACSIDGVTQDWSAELYAAQPERLVNHLSQVGSALESLGLEGGYPGLSMNVLTLVDDVPVLVFPIPEAVAVPSDSGDSVTAPETRRAGNGGSKADQYALAIVAAECLLGRRLKGQPARVVESSQLGLQTRTCLIKACHDNPSRRHPDVDAFLTQLSDSFVPRRKKIARHPAIRASAAAVILLAILLSLFHQHLGRFYEEHKPDLIADTTEAQLLAVKRLAQTREMVGLLTRFSANLNRDFERAESYLARQKTSSRPVAAEIAQAEAEFRQLATEQEFFEGRVMSQTQMTDIKANLAVVEQRHSDKAYADAVELVLPIYLRLQQAVSARRLLPDIALAINGLSKLRQRLPPADLSALAATQEQELIDLERQLLEANDYEGLVAQVYQPLVNLYTTEIQQSESTERIQQQAVMDAYLKSIDAEMVSIPAGKFKMGIVRAGATDSRPIRTVQVPAFRIGRYPVTNRQYNRFLQSKGVTARSGNRPDHPAVSVSWEEAQEFTNWLSRHSGERYRLPTEAEWEYVARANIRTQFPWGNGIGRNNANCADCGSRWDNNSTSPVGSFNANQFGVFDIIGNVWEWNRDCYLSNYRNAPTNGSAVELKSCQQRVARGGAWNTPSKKLHPAMRSTAPPQTRLANLGFRIVKSR